MADTVTLPGTGEVVATDDVGGEHYQRVKVDLGGDGAASPLVRGQQAAADSLPVVLASDQGAVPVSQSGTWTVQPGNTANTTAWLVTGTGGTFPATQSGTWNVTINAAIAAGDNNIGNVDIVTVPADPFGADADAASATGSISAKLRGIATALGVTAFDLGSGTGGSRTLRFFRDTAQWIGGAGSVTSAVQRTTLASDDPAVTALQLIDNAISGAGFNITQLGSAAVPIGAGTEAAAIRVTLPTNGTGVVGLNAGSALIGKVDHSSTGLGHGVTTVTTAGTDVALAGSTAAKWVIVQAQTDNTSTIAVGASGVDATIATGTGIVLYSGDSITLQIDNLADVFIDSLVNGEGVRYIYGT